MPKRVTIADVASLAGVHKATVSRALNVATEHQVNAETLKRVQEAARELGYIPNVMARGLRTSLSMTIGVIVPDLTNPIFPPVLRGIENHLSPLGYTALLGNTDGRDDVERAVFDSLLERRVDGFIFATARAHHPLLIEARDRDIRAVMVNRGDIDVPFPLVTGDDASGVAAAVRHLVDLGHRRLLHLAGPSNLTTGRVRAAAFVAACAAAGIEGTVIEVSALNVDAGFVAMETIDETSRDRPTAVVANNDLLALGAMRWLRSKGLNCPGDMSVVGFNDMPFAEDFSPALTTVRVPFLDMGAEAARLLLEGMKAGSQEPVTVSLPVSLVIRDSTAAPGRS